MRPQQARVVRMRKLSPKTPQDILRQEEIDSAEYDSLQGQYKIETGVEKSEESEYHLQAALAASGEKEGEIPAPLATAGEFDYDALYTTTFKTPATYIRSSQTVEECTGCQYSMSSGDNVFLEAFNEKQPTTKCSEDHFEVIMEKFEETAELHAPFASIDNTVIPFETMKTALKQQVSPKLHAFVQEIYQYWKAKRQESGNHPLQPSLKFETHQDNDDGDPYVCFRRREVRVQRKTRARDMHSTDKLKRIRKELENGRHLVQLALNREATKLQLLNIDELIFKQRASVKDQKIRLGIKGDDEDLINQKPPKKQRSDYSQLQRQPGSQLKMPARSDGRPLEADLIQLNDMIAQKENLLKAEIEDKASQHRKWNQNHVDLTRGPLAPVHGHGRGISFRPATAQFQLLTPPSSVKSDSLDIASPAAEKFTTEHYDPVAFQYVNPAHDGKEIRSQPAYRRRIGRNGRLWVDRRGMSSAPKGTKEFSSDRWKYDDDDDDEQPVYEFDPYDAKALRFRSTIPMAPYLTQRSRPEPSRSGGTSPTNSRTIPVALPATAKPS